MKQHFYSFFALCSLAVMASCNNTTVTDTEIANQYNALKDENLLLYDSIANLHYAISSTTVYAEAQNASNEQVDDIKGITLALLKNPQVITDSAVLGGKMAFENIKVLNENWIYASYSDGHVRNEAIFSYTRNRDKSYTFKSLLKLNQ